jgi:formylglycine-generating enzyme required for sulfatase activity
MRLCGMLNGEWFIPSKKRDLWPASSIQHPASSISSLPAGQEGVASLATGGRMMMSRRNPRIWLSLVLITFIFLAWALTVSFPTTSHASRTKGIGIAIKDRSGRAVGLYKESHALLIGVSDYGKGWPDLESVPDEIDRIEGTLTNLGFHVVKVVNPTGDELSAAFTDFIDRYGFDRDSRLLFFFSGHGYTRQGGKKGYLVPADAPDPRYHEKDFVRKALDMGLIMAWCRRIEAKHALFLFDSCFSGTIFKTKGLPKRPPHISDVTSRPVRQFISAGSAGEEVPARSVFVPSFIRALRGESDLDRDGYVTGTELGMYLHKKVLSYEAGQTPQYGKIKDPDLDEGDFVFQVPAGSDKDYEIPSSFASEKQRLAEERAQLERERRELEELKALADERKRLAAERKRLEAEKPKIAMAKRPPRPDKKSFTNAIGMGFVYISPDTFLMGSPSSEKKRDSNERQHEVSLTKGFYLQTTEVTQEQWESVMGTRPWSGKRYVRDGEHNPAVYISWNDCQQFIRRLNKRENTDKYRLPTEAEWEYACRANSTTSFSFGESDSILGDYSWYRNNAWNIGEKYAHAVAQKRSNAWGLYDMHGNVWEWCQDWYEENYPSGHVTDPEGPTSGAERVLRGGSWINFAGSCRSAFRGRYNPGNRNFTHFGFRVARDL